MGMIVFARYLVYLVYPIIMLGACIYALTHTGH